ncbi:MAG: hypothetical protein ABFC77_07900 [Thermoguttaceae bacterium]
MCCDAAGCPPDGSLLERENMARTIVVGLPAALGLLLFVGHAARQWVRWRRAVQRAQNASYDCEEAAMPEDRAAQSPLVFSLVEREVRRAAQRAKLSQSRRPGLLPRGDFRASDDSELDSKSVRPLPALFVVGDHGRERLRRAA